MLSEQIIRVLNLQPEYSSSNTNEMRQRGELIRNQIPNFFRSRIQDLANSYGVSIEDLGIEGRDGTGRKTEIPWVRIYSESLSPSAMDGWYVVLLFSALGSRLYITLGHGSTQNLAAPGTVEFRPRAPEEMARLMSWANMALPRELLANPRLTKSISLEARCSQLGARCVE